MKINDEIQKILKEYNIPKGDGICYLLSLHFGYSPSYIPDKLKHKINSSGIVKPDKTGLKWKTPLFEGGQTAFDWVKTEYVVMFKNRNPDKGGKVREATERMKKLFAENPEIRKEEVIEATRMYLSNTDPKYIRFPHFFIKKNSGANTIHDILDWIDKYRLTKNLYEGTESSTKMR